MTIENIKAQITLSESRIADYAGNIANWFGKDREVPVMANPEMPFESMYVKMMLDKMNGEYRNLKSLTAQLTEYEVMELV